MPKKSPKYLVLANELRSQIQKDTYQVGDLLPSEHVLCDKYQITRTTVRKALDELQREGYITRQHGKGSIVIERRTTLGLLTVKGFTDAVQEKVNTRFLQYPTEIKWPEQSPFQASKAELASRCMSFERIRSVNSTPVMVEYNWFAASHLEGIEETAFVGGSFFKTLSLKYGIEITGSQQLIKAIKAGKRIATELNLSPDSPIVQVDIRFESSHPQLKIYAQLHCNTDQYPIGNSFFKT